MLVTYHNIAHTQRLTAQIRAAIMQQRFPKFVQDFVGRQYPDGNVPQWVINALREACIDVT